MNPVISPLKRPDTGPAVKDLQTALLFLKDKGLFKLNAIQLRTFNKDLPGSEYSGGTQTAVNLFQNQFPNELQATGEVDEATAKKINDLLRQNGVLDSTGERVLKVRGKVTDAEQKPLDKLTVQAFDKDIRSKELLGETKANADGAYEITYTKEQFKKAEYDSADIFIRVFTIDGQKQVAESPVFFNVKTDVEINLVVEDDTVRSKSEYLLLTEKIKPVLDGLTYEVLKEEDVDFLSKEIGEVKERIQLLADAEKLRTQGNTDQLSHELLYGLGRQGYQMNLFFLANKKIKELKDALTQSVKSNIIGFFTDKQIEAFANTLHSLSIDFSLRNKQESAPHSLGEFLKISIPTLDLQTAFVSSYTNHEGKIEDFWTKILPENKLFKDNLSLIPGIQFSLQLSFLSFNHLPLIRALQERRKLTSPRDLVKLSDDDWKDILDTTGVSNDILGVTEDLKKEKFTKTVKAALQAAFPTDTVAVMIDRNRDLVKDANVREGLSQFFSNSTDFDITSHGIHKYLEDNTKALDGIPEEHKTGIVSQLNTFQRTLQLSPSSEAMNYLIIKDFTSAFKIASIPVEHFVEEHSNGLDGASNALAVHQRASFINLRNDAIIATAHNYSNSIIPAAIDINPQESQQVVIKELPDYQTLFGNVDFCECKDCRSILSPAAYFVDIMHFLSQCRANPDNQTPLDVLLSRRPDLEFTPLTCENTNTLIPYIDLANEVMESYVAYVVKKEKDNTVILTMDAQDTGSATTDELNANPQFVNDDAYKELMTSVFQMTLPYNQPLDMIRVYLDFLGVEKFSLMELFFKDDGTITPFSSTAAEYLKLSSEDYEVITTFKTDGSSSPIIKQSFGVLFGFHPTNVNWKDELKNVPEFLKRTGISYFDLFEIVNTDFLNPQHSIFEFLESINVGPQKLNDIANTGVINSQTDQNLLDFLASQRIGPSKFKDWANLQIRLLQGLILLFTPDSQCNLTVTLLQHQDGALLTDIEFLKINGFIRLKNKLKLSTIDLDRVLKVLKFLALPETDPFGINLILLLSHFLRIKDKLNCRLIPLLSLWGRMDTIGDDSLFKKIFLNKAVQKLDPDLSLNFDNSNIASETLKIDGHVAALLAAFRITELDLNQVRKEAGIDEPETLLNIDSISMMYRYVFLAKALRYSIRDFILLKKLIAINPFEASVFGPQKTEHFIDIASKIKLSGFSISLLNYLFKTDQDYLPDLKPSDDIILALFKTIRDGLIKIENDNKQDDDPDSSILQTKLSLIFDKKIVDHLVEMINGSYIFYSTIAGKPVLNIPDNLKERMSYDKTTGALKIKGAITTNNKTDFLQVSTDAGYVAAIEIIFNQPQNFLKDSFSAFLETDITKKPDDAFSSLFDDNTKLDVKGKFEYVLQSFLPFLKRTLKNTFITQTLSNALNLDTNTLNTLIQEILKPAEPLHENLYEDIEGLSTTGLTGFYFNSITPGNNASADLERIDESINFDWQANPDPATNKVRADDFSIRWKGKLTVPSNDTYTFIAEVNEGIRVKVDGEIIIDNFPSAPTNVLITETSKPLQLVTGKLYEIEIEFFDHQFEAIARLYWQTLTRPKEIIGTENFYPVSVINFFRDDYFLLHRVASLINGFQLTTAEIKYFDKQKSTVDFDQVDFNNFSFNHWQRLNNYCRLRNSFKIPLNTSFIDIFELAHNQQSTVELIQKTVEITGWDIEDLTTLTDNTHLNFTATDFINEIGLSKVRTAFDYSRRIGVKATQLFDWSKLETDYDGLKKIAQSIKDNVKSKYENSEWPDIAKPLSDILRENQRQALIAYLLPRLKFEDADQLFELLLVDVQMDACMETSRIKQAISSVQLFIDRCLLNLESNKEDQKQDVNPGQISLSQWEWRKHYRVWEAGRKVFIYPENWIEPELRDDKSPFFKELESELLHNDITNENAEISLMSYLTSLNQVSRLEICGLFDDKESGLVHVFGRTISSANKYFYRWYDKNNKIWSAWGKVELDIHGENDGNNVGIHLMPIVWNKRLFLFWPIFVLKTKQGSDPNRQEPYWEISIAYSEYRFNKWITKKQLNEKFISSQVNKDPAPQVGKPVDVLPFVESFFNQKLVYVTTDWDRGNYLPLVKEHFFKIAIDGTEVIIEIIRKFVHTIDVIHTQIIEAITTRLSDNIVLQKNPIGAPIETHNPIRYEEFKSLAKLILSDLNDEGFIQQKENDDPYVLHNPSQFHNEYEKLFTNDQFSELSIGQDVKILRKLQTASTISYDEYYLDDFIESPFVFSDLGRSFYVERPIFKITKIDLSSIRNAARARMEIGIKTILPNGAISVIDDSDFIKKSVADSSSISAMNSGLNSTIAIANRKNGFTSTGTFEKEVRIIGKPFVEEKFLTAYNSSGGEENSGNGISFIFSSFYHNYTNNFIKELNAGGIPGLLNLRNQYYGNNYLEFPWKFADPVPFVADSSACIIQRNVPPNSGTIGNFEMVFLSGDNLIHATKDNTNLQWLSANVIKSNVKTPASIIQSKNIDGRLEAFFVLGNDLVHFSKDGNSGWVPRSTVPNTKATGAPSVAIRNNPSISRLTFELIFPENTTLRHFTSLIDLQGNPEGWLDFGFISQKVTGPGCIIASLFPTDNPLNLEVVVPEGNKLAHYTMGFTAHWIPEAIVTEFATGPASMIQSGIRDGLHGNFELVVPEGNDLVHYFRDNSDLKKGWQRGQIITSKHSSTEGACIIQGSFADFKDNHIGNFEVIAKEGNRLVHYWNHNGVDRFYFFIEYQPSSEKVLDPYPKENIDFDWNGAYSLYNWELFFHAPLMIATRLSKNQRFEDAMKWFHYIFNPITDENWASSARFWNVLPFRDTPKDNIIDFFNLLGPGNDDPGNIIKTWSNNPFLPHLIARMRPIAYMKNVVMKYIDNLVAWGDYLFRQDTIESINEATQLYVIAAHILGPRPQLIPSRGKIEPKTYHDLKGQLDEFSNAKVNLENLFPFSGEVTTSGYAFPQNILGVTQALYFCIPKNDILLSYWDTVADRLFKIRHCMNIEGIVRQLPLFEPPIDPALLVQAAAQGLSLGRILNDLNTPTPFYRFSYVLQKALEVCGDLKSLGSALLSALEKKDAEELAMLRATHETELLKLVSDIKKKQYEETLSNKDALLKSRDTAIVRFKHYKKLLGEQDVQDPEIGKAISGTTVSLNESVSEESGVKIIPFEKEEMDKSARAAETQTTAAEWEYYASLAHMIPDFTNPDAPPAPLPAFTVGGTLIGNSLSAMGKFIGLTGMSNSFEAGKSAKLASYLRREQEWVFQCNLAGKEIMQIDKQLTASDIRIAIAQNEIDNHQQQIDKSAEVEDFLRNKYSNEDLYQWMKEQVFDVYSQAYQLAYDLAKKAEKCYRFERGETVTNFIQYGYWDSAYQGLFAGEKLWLSLKQMERAFIDNNKREYEITKQISLQIFDPLSLVQLKEAGQCEIDLPEMLFDADYPGHYMRRIKSVSLTIPCIVGPYTSINCTLTLLSNKIRLNSKLKDGVYEESIDAEDDRFNSNFASIQSIATSHAQNDSGLFELNFRDERYLPFEGAGVISRWKIELPKETNAFDLDSVSDVILKMNYTSREGGKLLGEKASEARLKFLNLEDNMPFARLFSLKHEFPNEWHKFLFNIDASGSHILSIELTKERFPFIFFGKKLRLVGLMVFLKTDEPNFDLLNNNNVLPFIKNSRKFGKLLVSAVSLDEEFTGQKTLTFSSKDPNLNEDKLEDIFLAVSYRLSN